MMFVCMHGSFTSPSATRLSFGHDNDEDDDEDDDEEKNYIII